MKKNIVLNNFNLDKTTVKMGTVLYVLILYGLYFKQTRTHGSGGKKTKAFLGLVGMLGLGGSACLSGDQRLMDVSSCL